ncbi:MAG: ASCH domain-containing protein [Kofleriaceae bacterium]
MRALIMDRTHRVVVVEVPSTDERPLLSFEAVMPELPAPAGSRPCRDGGRDFIFVMERVIGGRRLGELDPISWKLYVELMLGGYFPPTQDCDVWSFGDEPDMAGRLAHLVAHGKKRATMDWLDNNPRDYAPKAKVDGVSIVTDGLGYPRVVLRTVSIDVKAFRDVTPEDAAAEGEGDLSYEDWREGHLAYFTRQSARTGIPFDDSARIAVERFEVLHIL